MDGIDSVSGIAAGHGSAAAGRAASAPITAAASPVEHPRQATTRSTQGGEIGTSQVHAGGIGRDGRFEKLILAVQALRLDYGVAEHATEQRVREMREAAEEIFQIDGVPAPIEPAAAAAPELEAPPAITPPGAERTPASGANPGANPGAMPGAEPPQAAPNMPDPAQAPQERTRAAPAG